VAAAARVGAISFRWIADVLRRVWSAMHRSRVASAFVVFMMCAGTILWVSPPAMALGLTRIRTIGTPRGTGHAYVYGWGVAYQPFGNKVIVGDYWNLNVRAFNLDGTPTPLTIRGGTHQAPYGIAVDPRNGDFYVGDVDAGYNVDKYDKDGNFLLTFGQGGDGNNRFRYPAWMAVRDDGRVFVMDSRADNYEIHQPDGTFLAQCGSRGAGPNQFNRPRGAAFDGNGNLYIADNNNMRVQVFDTEVSGCPTFVRQWKIGTNGEKGNFHGDLRGLAVDRINDWVYVVDGVSQYTHKYTTTGAYLLSMGGQGTAPGRFIDGGRGVAVDPAGNVWVGDMPNFRVQKFSPSGAVLGVAPDPPMPPPTGGFNHPTDVGLDAGGNVFVSDTHNWRNQKFTNAGTFLLTWGSRGSGNYGFNYQKSLDVDRRDGSVLVADSDAGKIKKYTNDGVWLWTTEGFGKVKSLGVEVGPDGTVYASDFAHGSVQVIGANGTPIREIARGVFQEPRGVCYDDSDDTLWIVDRPAGKVYHYTLTGTRLGSIGSKGTAANQLWDAQSCAISGNTVFITDNKANSTKAFTKGGAFLGAFSTGVNPHGLEIGPDGNLYVTATWTEQVFVYRINA
jgi:tripartite motif-containing protein 71